MEGYVVFGLIMLLVIVAFVVWIARPWEAPRARRISHPTVEDALEAIDRTANPWRGNS
jgi:hypothetical protein